MESSDFKNPPKSAKKIVDFGDLPPPDSVVTIPRYNGMLSAPSAGFAGGFDPAMYDTATEAENEIDDGPIFGGYGGEFGGNNGGAYVSMLTDLATSSTNMPDMNLGKNCILTFPALGHNMFNLYVKYSTWNNHN